MNSQQYNTHQYQNQGNNWNHQQTQRKNWNNQGTKGNNWNNQCQERHKTKTMRIIMTRLMEKDSKEHVFSVERGDIKQKTGVIIQKIHI